VNNGDQLFLEITATQAKTAMAILALAETVGQLRAKLEALQATRASYQAEIEGSIVNSYE
jgi:cell division protein FtsB